MIIRKQSHESFCSLPFQNFQLDTSGGFRPCCKALEAIPKPDGSLYKLPEDDLDKVWMSPYLENLRAAFKRGEKPKTCKNSWSEEAAGIKSLRQHRVPSKERVERYISEATPHAPVDLDLKPSNLCNLKCRICNAENSTSWHREAQETLGFEMHDYKRYSSEKFNAENQKVLKGWFESVRHLEFFGGEPFLLKEHIKILDLAIESGYASRLTLNYNTNATVFSEQLLKTWQSFELINLGFSIDGVAERFTYQRHPAKWSTAKRVVDQFYQNRGEHIKLRFDVSIGVLNVLYLDEVFDWAASYPEVEVRFNLVHHPLHYSIKCLPAAAKAMARQKLEECLNKPAVNSEGLNQVIQFMFEENLEDQWQEFLIESRRADLYRGESLAEAVPLLAPWLADTASNSLNMPSFQALESGNSPE